MVNLFSASLRVVAGTSRQPSFASQRTFADLASKSNGAKLLLSSSCAANAVMKQSAYVLRTATTGGSVSLRLDALLESEVPGLCWTAAAGGNTSLLLEMSVESTMPGVCWTAAAGKSTWLRLAVLSGSALPVVCCETLCFVRFDAGTASGGTSLPLLYSQ